MTQQELNQVRVAVETAFFRGFEMGETQGYARGRQEANASDFARQQQHEIGEEILTRFQVTSDA